MHKQCYEWQTIFTLLMFYFLCFIRFMWRFFRHPDEWKIPQIRSGVDHVHRPVWCEAMARRRYSTSEPNFILECCVLEQQSIDSWTSIFQVSKMQSETHLYRRIKRCSHLENKTKSLDCHWYMFLMHFVVCLTPQISEIRPITNDTCSQSRTTNAFVAIDVSYLHRNDQGSRFTSGIWIPSQVRIVSGTSWQLVQSNRRRN